MGFFVNMTVIKIIGIILLAIGAIVAFMSGKLAKNASFKTNITIKLIGLGVVIVAFLILAWG